MRSSAVFASLLASGALAQPHGHSNHRRFHEKKDAGLDKRNVVTEWVTEVEWQTVTEIIDESTTLFITGGLSTTPTTHSTAPAPSSSSQGGEFFEGSSSSVAAAAPATTKSTTSVYVAPTTSTTEAAPPPTTTSTYVAPVESTPTPVAQAPATTSTTAAAPAATTAASSGGGSGQTYSGDLTYYALGLGSCGIDDSGKDRSANIVAMAAGLMGAVSNGNPMCGKTITVTANGKSVVGLVHDKCPGCAGSSIDVSEAMFLALFGSLDVGRGQVTWQWNS